MKALALIVVLGACTMSSGDTLGTTWKRAWASADCAPWDGLAASVFMTDAPEDSVAAYPLLRISVYHPLGSVGGKRWSIGESGPDGAAGVLCAPGTNCTSATGGWVEFQPATEAGPLRGRYLLTMPDGRPLTGSFSAPVRQRTMMCG